MRSVPGFYTQTLALAAALDLETSTPLTEAGRKSQRALYIILETYLANAQVITVFSTCAKSTGKRSILRLPKGHWIKQGTTYKPPQGPQVFSTVPFITFEHASFGVHSEH